MLINLNNEEASGCGGSCKAGYLRTADAARYLSIGTSTLERKRVDGTGPQFRILGSKVVAYAISDLDEWAGRCVRTSTYSCGSNRNA